MRRLSAWIIGIILLAGGVLGAAPGFDPDRDVALELQDSAVVLTVPAGAHLKSSFLEVALGPGQPGSLRVGPLPPTDAKDDLGAGIWHGRVVVPLAGAGLRSPVAVEVTYQPCTEGFAGICYPPRTRTLRVDAAAISAAGPPSGPPRHLLLVLLGMFGAGLLASLTPCVYPMIPITMAVIGAKGGGRRRALLLSLALVLGMAATYTTLGVLAARTGRAFGAFAQTPGFLVPVSLLFGLFALSLLGAFEIRLPARLQERLQGSGPRQGLAGAFLMGLVLGPISAPCVGPVIGSVLLAIAQSGRILLGAVELFTFALGMGVLFTVVGTGSAALPRSGPWLVRLKQAMGLVVLGFAIWNVRLVVPGWLSLALWSLTALLGAAVLGAFRPAEGLPAGLAKGLGWLCLALGVLLGLRGIESGLDLTLLPATSPAAVADDPHPGWMAQDLEGALARARAAGKPVLVDVYADWCVQCKELDKQTWPDPDVAAWVRDQAVAVRVDTDRVRPDLARKLGILGYPTVILLAPDGRELRRVAGFLPPAGMLAFLRG